MTEEVQVGDRGRFTVEAVVQGLRPALGIIEVKTIAGDPCMFRRKFYEVEIIEKAKPKVGETVPVYRLDRLPVGAVVRGCNSRTLWFQSAPKVWTPSSMVGLPINQTSGRYEIVYLP